MTQKPIIDLRYTDWNGPGLIILFKSGVEYTNQTGGNACLSPLEEGVFIPLYDGINNQEEKLIEYFDAKYSSSCMNGIDVDDAEYIDSIMQSGSCSRYISVDLGRLDESHEAWVYVKLSNVPDISRFSCCNEVVTIEEILNTKNSFYGFNGCRGVLTWENSD